MSISKYSLSFFCYHNKFLSTEKWPTSHEFQKISFCSHKIRMIFFFNLLLAQKDFFKTFCLQSFKQFLCLYFPCTSVKILFLNLLTQVEITLESFTFYVDKTFGFLTPPSLSVDFLFTKAYLGAIQYLHKQIEMGRWSVKCLLL